MREINVEELGKHRLLLASPQFGGMCSSIFARSLSDLSLICGQYRLPLGTCLIYNESLITRARNRCVDIFMGSGAEHLLFIDADIGFKAQDALELLILQIQHPEYEIIGGPYKQKTLEGVWAFNYETPVDPAAKEPVEVTGIGTGFMMVHRKVFEKFKDAYPEYHYASDDKADFGREVTMYFQAEIEKSSGRYLSEDYWFAHRCSDIGIRTWICPWMKLRHAGTYVFE